MSRRRSHLPLWHPLHWPMWLGVGFLRALTYLPWSVQLAIGRKIGRLALLFLRDRRRVILINLKLCFPEWTKAERKALAIAHYEAIGIGIFETAMAWWSSSRRLPRYEIVGREHLEAASAGGRGVILLGAHFTTLEICGRMFLENLPMGGLFREPDHPVVAHEMYRARILKMTPAVHMNDIRGFIRALKNGAVMWYAPDQGRKSKHSVLLPFFGIPALTTTATSRISGISGAAVVPFFTRRLPDHSYLLTIFPPLDNFPSIDAEADSIRTNRMIEEQIRLSPEQYFWIHRRFKHRGGGHKNVYRRKKS